MLAVQSYEMTRQEIVELIEKKCARMNVEPGKLLRAYRRGDLEDFGEYADILALSELLEEDDALFTS